MEKGHESNAEQSSLWNGSSGRAWVEMQTTLDQMFRPIENLLVQAIPDRTEVRVLDVGCGTGSTSLAIARRFGARARCLGVDISGPMIEVARTRAQAEGLPAHFVKGDAQLHAFEPACFDMIVSRFGVMFFDDPVRAFENLRLAAGRGGGLRFAAWRSAEENPFMTVAERVAAPLLPELTARRPDAPGQFAFADRSRMSMILRQSGWADIDIHPIDVPCALPEPELIGYLSRLGPVGALLQRADGPTRARVLSTVRAAFDPYVHGDEVRFTAACWMVGATAPSHSQPPSTTPSSTRDSPRLSVQRTVMRSPTRAWSSVNSR